MKVVFIPGGRINDLGPFEAGEEIHLPQTLARQLIKDGLATLIQPPSVRPITITLKVEEITNV